MSLGYSSRVKQVSNAFYSDEPYFTTVVSFDVSDKESGDIFRYFYSADYVEVEKDLDPLYDVMHFYRKRPKEGDTEENAFYLLMTVPKTDDFGSRILYVYSIQAYCDSRGPVFTEEE